MSQIDDWKQKAKAEFIRQFGEGGDIRTFFAPGRVNLIGEHTDYNGGHVFPCALTMGTLGVARKREDNKVRFYSMNVSRTGIWEDELPDLKPFGRASWADYPKGVCWAMGEKGHPLPCGLDLLVAGDVPNGSGLSSSASLEVMTGMAIKVLFGMENVSLPEIALISQFSENEFNGMNCGIMDQFASAMGKKDHAIYLDTSTLEYEYVPVLLKDVRLVITNSKVKHSLVGSAYNDRRRECEEALAQIRAAYHFEQKEKDATGEQKQNLAGDTAGKQEKTLAQGPAAEPSQEIQALGALSGTQFELVKHVIENPVCAKRAKHAVYENQRTHEAVEALKAGRLDEFGKLMNASHISLRDDYEVSCPELDLLASLAWSIPGVIGSRITGGGFGGCTVSLVKDNAVDAFREKLAREYEKETGIVPEFYVADIGDGAREI